MRPELGLDMPFLPTQRVPPGIQVQSHGSGLREERADTKMEEESALNAVHSRILKRNEPACVSDCDW
jgi:hypothetical protein